MIKKLIKTLFEQRDNPQLESKECRATLRVVAELLLFLIKKLQEDTDLTEIQVGIAKKHTYTEIASMLYSYESTLDLLTEAERTNDYSNFINAFAIICIQNHLKWMPTGEVRCMNIVKPEYKHSIDVDDRGRRTRRCIRIR